MGGGSSGLMPGPDPVLAFQMLVQHPETAPIVHSTYPAPLGSLEKFTTNFTIGTGTNTAYAILYAPGTSLLLTRGSDLSSTAALFNAATITVANTVVPGSQFLLANASAFRAIASCVKVSYLGTELNRAGTILMGSISAAEMARQVALGAGANAVDSLANLSPVESRTTDHCQVWAAGDNDKDYLEVADTATLAGPDVNGRNGIMLLARGLTAGSAVRVKITTIYEYQPTPLFGAPINSVGPARLVLPGTIQNAIAAVNGTAWTSHVGDNAVNALTQGVSSLWRRGAAMARSKTGQMIERGLGMAALAL